MNTHQLPTRPDHGASPLQVTLVRSDACHLCDEAHGELLRLALDRRISYQIHAATSARGQELLAEHRPGMFPLVLVDGAFFSSGRLPRRKLDKLLASRVAA